METTPKAATGAPNRPNAALIGPGTAGLRACSSNNTDVKRFRALA